MKGLGLLMACLMMSYISSSQPLTLRPIRILHDSVEYLGFDKVQSKAIAKIIVKKQYGDSIQDISSQVIKSQDSIISSQKRQVNILRNIIENNTGQIANLNILNETLKINLSDAQAKAGKLKKRRWLYFVAGIISASTVTYLVK